MNSGDKIRELINEANSPPKTFTERNLRLDLPVSESGDGYNTRLEVEGIPGRGYYNSVDVFYRRVDLGIVNTDTPLRTINPLTPQLVLDLFNGAKGLFLTLDDVEPFDVPELADGESGSVTLVTVATSLGFTGTTTFGLEYGRSWLDSVVGNRNLPVLNHPIKLDGRMSARMMTWSKDFTSLRDSIKPDKNGNYTDWETVQAACGVLGIPPWGVGKIADYPTSAIADANPLFDRVVIQRNAVGARMVGDVYFHYNNLEEI